MATDAPITGAPSRAPAIDRRMLLVGAAAVPILAASAAPAFDLETAFAEWKRSIWTINHHSPLTDEQVETLWDRVNRIELALMASPVGSPRMAAARLWIGLETMLESAVDTDAVTTENIDFLMRGIEDRDWNIQCVIRALHAIADSQGKA